MKRTHFAALALAVALCGAAALAAGPVAVVAVLPLALLVLGAPFVSASRGYLPAARNARRLPHWLDVAVYRLQRVGHALRDKLGAAMFAWQLRSGQLLAAFPGTVAADLAFGIVGELAFDGPFRSQPARINHGTAADIVVGRWFTLAADGSARPGGAGAIGGILMSPKQMGSIGTSAGGPLAPTMTVPTGTIGEFGYMGAFVVAAPAAVALGAAAKYDTTTGVIGVGAPGGGEAAIPNSKFVRQANAAAGLAVLEITN